MGLGGGLVPAGETDRGTQGLGQQAAGGGGQSHAPPALGTAGGRGSSDAAEAGGAAGVAGAGGRRWGVLGVRLVGVGAGKLGLF